MSGEESEHNDEDANLRKRAAEEQEIEAQVANEVCIQIVSAHVAQMKEDMTARKVFMALPPAYNLVTSAETRRRQQPAPEPPPPPEVRNARRVLEEVDDMLFVPNVEMPVNQRDRLHDKDVMFLLEDAQWRYDGDERNIAASAVLRGNGPTDREYLLIEEWTRLRQTFTLGRFCGEITATRLRFDVFKKLQTCAHPDAIWLRNTLEMGADNDLMKSEANSFYIESHAERLKRLIKNREYLGALFEQLATTGKYAERGIATFFSACFGADRNGVVGKIKVSAELGYAPAQSWMSNNALLPPDQQFYWAQLSAAQYDPEGLYQLGHCYLNGIACRREHLKGSVLMMNAANAGHTAAQCVRARLCDRTHPEKTVWFHRAALGGTFSGHYGKHIVEMLTGFTWDAPSDEKRAIFVMGKLLKGVTDFEKCRLYAETVDYGTGVSGRERSHENAYGYLAEQITPVFRCVSEAICLFDHWLRKTREAVDAWVASALRLTKENERKKRGYILVPRDMRKMIGEYVWASRVDGLYTAPKLPSQRDTIKRMRLDDGFI